MSQPPLQPQLQVHDDGGYSDSGTSLGFGSDAEDWTDIDVLSSGRGSDDSGSESGDDDRIADYNLAQSSEWQAIVASTPTLATPIPVNTASTATLGPIDAILPDQVQPSLEESSSVPDNSLDVATLPASSDTTRQPFFDLQFPDPLESSMEGDNLLHELGRRNSSLRRKAEEFVAQRPPGSLADSLLTQPDVCVYPPNYLPPNETAAPVFMPPLTKTRSKLQVTYLGYAPALYKREIVTQALVSMAGPDIDIVFVENADLSSSVHSSYSSPYNPSIPTLALVFLNPPLPMPTIPATLINVRFLPVLMPSLNTSSSGSNSLLSLSMSSLFDLQPQPLTERVSKPVLGRDRAEVAEEEWLGLNIPLSSVLVTRWKKTVVELAEIESEEPELAVAIQDIAVLSKQIREEEDDQRSTWIGALAISLVALLLGSTLLSAGAPLNASRSTPSPIDSLSPPTQTPFWHSGIFTSLSGIFNSSASPSSPPPPLPVATSLSPSVHKGYSLSVFSSSEPLKQILSTGRSKKAFSGHHCEHDEPRKDRSSWASKLTAHVPPPPSEPIHQHSRVLPIIQTERDEESDTSPETSLGRVLASSIRLSYDTFSRILVRDLQELMMTLEELFAVVKAHTKNSFIGPVRETIIDPIHVNVVQPICESFAENVVDPLLTNIVEPLKANIFDPLAAHLAERHERAKHNGRDIVMNVAKRHERAVKNAKAIGENARAFGKALSDVMVWTLQGREVLNPPKTEKSVQPKENVSKWAKVSQAASAKMGKAKAKKEKATPAAGMSRRQRKVKKTKAGVLGRVRRVRT